MSLRSKLLLGIAAVIVLGSARIAWDYFDHTSPANQAMQYQLKLFGDAMYEYRTATGRWPARLEELAATSLPRRSFLWRQTAQTLVLLWPKDLGADPKANAKVLLAYDRGGLFNRLGRVWVCWGDLRTEQMRDTDLRAQLANQDAGRREAQ